MRKKIQVGDLVAGCYLPTERELQVDFGASRTTVRKALAALVESGWAQNIPNRGVIATRGIRPGVSRNVAFISTGDHVARILLAHSCELLEDHGINLVAIRSRTGYPLENALQRAVENDYLGAIVWPNVGFPDVAAISEIARSLPIVALDHRIPGIETDLVTFDHEQAAFDATDHLIRQGAKRVGISGMMDMLDITHDRFKGYLRALFANGHQPNATDFLFTMTSGNEVPDSLILQQVLLSANKPDSFFVLQDFCLPSVVSAAHDAGLKLPTELKLVTIGDDVDVSVGGARMSAIAYDWSSLAKRAVSMLLGRIEHPNRPRQVSRVAHTLKIRGLCGAPQDQWSTGRDTLLGPFEKPSPKSQYVFCPFGGSEVDPQNLTAEKFSYEKSIHSY